MRDIITDEQRRERKDLAAIFIGHSPDAALGPNQPYPNIQAAASAIQPGDTVYLHTGSYT